MVTTRAVAGSDSIGRQAMRRLLTSIGLLVALIAVGSAGIYQAALQKAAVARADELAAFYSARLGQIEREWEVRSRDVKMRIEVTRILEHPATAGANLRAFMTIQGADRPFQYAMIQTEDGRKLFGFGEDLDLPSIPAPAAAGPGHYRDPKDGRIYRVFEHRIVLGEKLGTGRLAVFMRIDNALLRQMSTPGLSLVLLYDGVPVASSDGQAAVDLLADGHNAAGREVRALPWSGRADDPIRLSIAAPVATLFAPAELALVMSGIPLIDGVVLWFALGIWLLRQTRRITRLGGAVGAYGAAQQATPAMAAMLADARGGGADEITAVADGLEALAAAIDRRGQEREDALARLREGEQRFRQLFESMSNGVAVYAATDGGADFVFTDVNAAVERIEGRPRGELIGRRVTEVFPGIVVMGLLSVFRRVWESGNAEHFPQAFYRDGRISGWRENFVYRLPSGELVAMYDDATARMQAAERLNESHNLLRTIIDTTPLRIFWKDRDSRYLGGNAAFAKDAGLVQPEDLIGKDDFQLGWKEHAERYRADDRTVMATGIPKLFCDELQIAPDGSRCWLRTSKVPLRREPAGEIIGVLGIYEDITAQKQTEAALVDAMEVADRANSAKSAFVANMSHEIRTPLHVITGLGHLLRRDIDDPAQLERLDHLCASSDHLLAIVNDVLDLSKIEAQQLVLDRTDFRLDAMVEKVVRMAEGPAHEKGLLLATDIASRLRSMSLTGDPQRLAQVLINLCNNAVKFTDHGAVRLAIGCTAKAAESVTLRFSVEDTGIGIAPAEQARLFRPFTQADSSTTRERGGTGLGLAISQRLVGLMGGTIRVDSVPGRGSTFRFELVLPRAAVRVRKAAPGAAAVAADFHGRQVLITEDHPLGQEILLEMLEDLGCEADVAADGLEAVECARERNYDLILMDMQMPKMDGLAATRAIRMLPGHRATPIIALTANAFADDRQRCLDAGMNGHLGKPVTPETLVVALRPWLPRLAVPRAEVLPGDNALSRALAKIPGLEVGHAWRSSPERLVDYCTQLERFVRAHTDDLALLHEHLTRGEHEAAHVIVHNLKGIAGLIGARRVAALASELMQALRAGAEQAVLVTLAGTCVAELAGLAEALCSLPAEAAAGVTEDAKAAV